MKLSAGAMLIVLLAGAVLWLQWCHDPAVRAEAIAAQHDVALDSVIALHRQATADSASRYEQRLATLKARRIPVDTLRVVIHDTVVIQQIVVRDSIIAADSLEKLFWQSQTFAYRDTIVPQLVAARDAWRKQAKRPNHMLTDIAGAAIAGWGLAKDDGQIVKAGFGLVVLPRVWGWLSSR